MSTRNPVATSLGVALLLACTLPAIAQDNEPAAAPAEPVWYGDHPVDAIKAKWVPGKGLRFDSADGLFRLQTRLRAQFRYEYEKGTDASFDEGEQALMIRRARATFSGHWWGKNNAFKMELAVSPKDLGLARDQVSTYDAESGTSSVDDVDSTPAILSDKSNRLSRSPLLDFYVQFKRFRDFNLRLGQYKVPYSRQRVVSSGNQMFVDRSILNSEFTLDRDIGLDLRSRDLFGLGNRLKYYAGLWAGEGHSSYRANDFGMMYIVRMEALPFGKFKDYSESALERPEGPRLSLGIAYGHVRNARGQKGVLGSAPGDGLTTDTDNLTADLLFKWSGFSLQSEFYMREGTRPEAATEAPRDGWGAMAQAGYLLPGMDLELALRYASLAGTGDTILADRSEAGAALSYYFARHPYKLQADLRREWAESMDEGDDVLRVQLQTSF